MDLFRALRLSNGEDDQTRAQANTKAPQSHGLAPSRVTSLARMRMARLTSEVRSIRFGDVRVFVAVIFVRILGTDAFRYLVGSRHIGQGRGPRRREDAFILDRHMQLQELAAVL